MGHVVYCFGFFFCECAGAPLPISKCVCVWGGGRQPRCLTLIGFTKVGLNFHELLTGLGCHQKWGGTCLPAPPPAAAPMRMIWKLCMACVVMCNMYCVMYVNNMYVMCIILKFKKMLKRAYECGSSFLLPLIFSVRCWSH